jgi:hypothetical protein
MDILQAFTERINACEPCRYFAKIINYNELPDEEKVRFSDYNHNEHFLIKCERCKTFEIVKADKEK